MFKKRCIYITLLLTGLLCLQACSLLPRVPEAMNSKLQAAMQQSDIGTTVEQPPQIIPIKLDYELKHIPLPGQNLLIALDIKPAADFHASAYAVKAPDAFEVFEPQQAINLGSLKAGEVYREHVGLKPIREGLFAIKVFLAVEKKGDEPQIKLISIPISVGPFQRSREALQ